MPICRDQASTRVLFPESAVLFREAVAAVLADLDREDPDRAVEVAAECCLDLSSSLRCWRLEPLIATGDLERAEVEAAAERFAAVVRGRGSAAAVAAMTGEGQAIAGSRMRQVCGKTAQGELATYWGHDYCTGMDFSIRRGARFVTTNPAKINLFRKENPATWDRLLAEARREDPAARGRRLVSAMFVKVAAINARRLRPIFDATGGEHGFVCVQTNPLAIADSDAMVDEVRYWEQAFRRELGTEDINVVYKLPAVPAAVAPVRALVAEGIRVCMTLNFTVTQHEVFADLIEAGNRNGFVVLMSGFLDDTVALELEQAGVADPKRYAKWAGVSVMRKSYAALCRRGIRKAAIMAAAIRGPYTIASCLTDDDAAPVYFTTMPEKIREFDAADTPLVSTMAEPIPAEVLAVLERSASFRQAYHPEALALDGVMDFAPLQAVLRVFTDAAAEIEHSLA